jgi:hypothetical protein
VRTFERRNCAIERTNVRAPKKRSNAPMFVQKRGDRSPCDRSQPESINRPVNIEKRHTIFGEELTTFKKQFSGFILFLYFIL